MSKKEKIIHNLTNDMHEFIIQCQEREYSPFLLVNAFMAVIVAIGMGGYSLSDYQKKSLHNILDDHINRYEPLGKKPPKD